MHVHAIQTRIFQEGEDLIRFITEHLPSLEEKSVLIVTSKIVALAEGRTVIVKDDGEKAELIKAESDSAVETKYIWLTVKDNMIMASAGIDESNADTPGKMILLPKDSFVSADMMRTALKKHYGITELGVIVTDSRTQPLRAGITGAALGYAGFGGIKDYRGTGDIFGRTFRYSQVNLADSLAAAGVVTMGEGDEKRPLAVITDAPVTFQDTVDRMEGRIPLEDDMYLPFFGDLPKDFL